MRAASLIAAFIIGTIFASFLALAWTGPTSAPPNGNVSAPLNVGTTDQIKNAGLGLNSLAVFGNAILSGTSRYLSFGTTAGSSGYGLRDNAGTMEFKNSGGSWHGVAADAPVPSFRVHSNGVPQTVTPATTVMLTWTTEEFDTNNNFASNRFTPTVPGKYLVHANITCVNGYGQGYCLGYIYKNGSAISFTETPSNYGIHSTANVTTIVDMNGTTDYLEAYVHNSNTEVNGDSGYTNFSGALISK